MAHDKKLIVNAFWDDEAQVWWATSDDIPGLATEAASPELLLEKLLVIIPELIEANGIVDGDSDEIPFELVSVCTRAAVAHRQYA